MYYLDTNLIPAFAEISKYPKLTNDEIYHEYEQYDLTKNVKHMQKIILHNLKFVIHIAMKYKDYGLPINDIIQEGNIGLMIGVKKFDYKLAKKNNTGLISYIVHDIRGHIFEFIIKNIGLVKTVTTKDHRKIFFNRRKFFSYPRPLNDNVITEIYNDMNLKYKKSVREMEERLSIKNLSIHEDPFDNNNDSFNNIDAFQITTDDRNSLDDNYYDNKENESKNTLSIYLDVLTEQEKYIISKRWLSNEKSTLHDLSLVYNVSKERIRQIEKKALFKMKKINE